MFPRERKALRQRMYKKGELITDIADLVREIEANRYVIYHDRPNHPAWISSMQLRVLIGQVRTGRFHFAIKQPVEE
jgi:hypothetical protein